MSPSASVASASMVTAAPSLSWRSCRSVPKTGGWFVFVTVSRNVSVSASEPSETVTLTS